MTGHQDKVQSHCRLCQTYISGIKSYNIDTSDWICEFLNNHVFQNNFQNEDKERYSRYVCYNCFQKLIKAKNNEKTHVQKERKKPKARRTDFVANIDIAVVDDDQWNHIDENCKVCGIGFQEQVVEPHIEEAPDPSSPAVVKRKEVSPNLTPQAKKSQRIMSGSGRPTQLFQKETTINVDEEIEMDIVEEKKSHISSENKVILNKNIKDSNLKDVFQCVVCKRIPREPLILEKCGHYCCRVCIYDFIKISKKCPKCKKIIWN